MKTLLTILLLTSIASAQWTLMAYNEDSRLEMYNTYTAHADNTVTIWARWTMKTGGKWTPAGKSLLLIDCDDYGWIFKRVITAQGKVAKTNDKWTFFKEGQIGYIASKKICDDNAGSNR